MRKLNYEENCRCIEMNKQHNMKLYEKPFNLVQDGIKKIEVRCYDEKRRQLKVGDTIVFTHYDDAQKTIRVTIRDMQVFATFRELYSSFPINMFGHPDSNVDEMVAAVYDIYSKEQERQYGAIAIIIE